MTFTLGRASFTNDPYSVAQDGDIISLSFNILPSTLADAKMLRHQVLGLANNQDEPVVPFAWSEDSDYDGFYTVLASSVEPTEAYLQNRLMRANVTIERVAGGYVNPAIESYVVGRIATNGNGVTTATSPLFSLIAAFVDTDGDTGVLSEFDTARFPFTSNALQYRTAPSNTDVYTFYNEGEWTESSRQLADPANHYVGSCAIENAAGQAYVGRQLPAGAEDDWVLSNGIVRIKVDGTANVIKYSRWSTASNAWTSDQSIQFGSITAGSFTPDAAKRINGNGRPVVLRNTPEMVVVRTTTGGQPGVTFTFSVWRGGGVVMCHVYTATATNAALGLSPTAAGTSVSTWGVRKTGTDGGGETRYTTFANRQPATVSTTHTAITPTTATTSTVFGIGPTTGSTATGPHQYPGFMHQIVCPPQWRDRVVTR